MSGHDGHAHDHGGRGANARRLALVLALAGAYMVAEVVGGLVTNSLALLADAGHMLTDVAALALSLFAIWMARKPATPHRSYGYHRTEILAALVNGGTLVAIAVLIFIEAYRRFREPPEVQGALMMGIAAGGLGVNLLGLWILSGGKGDSLNVRGAWLHVLTDALGSVGAILGGAAIWFLGWAWADPAVSVLISLLVLYSSWNLLRETLAVLMEGAPRRLRLDEVRTALVTTPGVLKVHDLHVWSITSGMVALSAHVTITDVADHSTVLASARAMLHERFAIDHTTLQLEKEACKEGETHA